MKDILFFYNHKFYVAEQKMSQIEEFRIASSKLFDDLTWNMHDHSLEDDMAMAIGKFMNAVHLDKISFSRRKMSYKEIHETYYITINKKTNCELSYSNIEDVLKNIIEFIEAIIYTKNRYKDSDISKISFFNQPERDMAAFVFK